MSPNLFKLDDSSDQMIDQPTDNPAGSLPDPPIIDSQPAEEPTIQPIEPTTNPSAELPTAPVTPKTYGPYPKRLYHRFGLSSRLIGSKQEEINMGNEWADKPFANEYAIIEEDRKPSNRFI